MLGLTSAPPGFLSPGRVTFIGGLFLSEGLLSPGFASGLDGFCWSGFAAGLDGFCWSGFAAGLAGFCCIGCVYVAGRPDGFVFTSVGFAVEGRATGADGDGADTFLSEEGRD